MILLGDTDDRSRNWDDDVGIQSLIVHKSLVVDPSIRFK